MSREAEYQLQRELSSGEQLLWSGMPAQGLRLQPYDVFFIPFSLLWGGFAVFWEIMAIVSGAPFFFKLWGIPFVLVGLYITIGRFYVDSHLRSKTFYGVTNQRIIIVSGLMNRQVKSLSLQGLSDISISERSNDSGSILFGPMHSMHAMWSGCPWPGMGSRFAPTFSLSERTRDVYNLIREAQGRYHHS